jgi:hypothetical protein
MSNCIFEPIDYTSSCKRCGKQKFEHTIATITYTEVAMSKQTAVEWLVEEIHKNGNWIPTHMIEQAKEMENSQKKEMYVKGIKNYDPTYANETYGGNNSEITMNNQSSTFPYVCASCNKEMVAGGFPKWFCLHTTCKNYLKPITK